MSHNAFHLGQHLNSWLQGIAHICAHAQPTHTHTLSEGGGITQVLIFESLVLPCSCGQHTVFNPNIFGSAVHTPHITATDIAIQCDTHLLITVDDHDTGLGGKLRSECAKVPTGCLPAHTVWSAVCV